MTSRLRKGLLFSVFSCLSCTLIAKDIYVSQSGGGTTNSLAWLNSTYTWVPGDTIHLTGTFTNTLAIGGSGTAGNPITFLFEPGAGFVRDYWGTGRGAAIYGSGVAYVVIDGQGTGLIAATNNGTLLGLQNGTCGIYLTPAGAGITIKGLNISNLFQRVPLPAGNTTNNQPSAQGIYIGGSGCSGLNIRNNNLLSVANAITLNYGGDCSTVNIVSNRMGNVSFGIFINCSAAGTSDGFNIEANWATNFAAYDGSWEAGGHNHNNGIIVNASAAATNNAMRIVRNFFGLNVGTNVTSMVKVTPDYQDYYDMVVANNILQSDTANAQLNNGFIGICPQHPHVVANNTVILTGANASGFGNKPNGLFEAHYNNLYKGVSMNVNCVGLTATPFTNSDYNAYQNIPSDGSFYGFGAITYRDFGGWKSDTGYDAHSITITPTLDASFAPLTNDTMLINAGTNLTSLGITNDFAGNPRPATGPWTIGAFQSARAKSSFVAPPTIISVTPSTNKP